MMYKNIRPRDFKMTTYIQNLRLAFQEQANPEIATQQKAYMRDKFEYFGLKSPEQTLVRRKFLNENGLPEINELEIFITKLWQQPERELQYFGMRLVEKFINKTDADFIAVLEYSKTDPDAVVRFVESHELKPLSRKEALKVIERKKQKSFEKV